MEGRGRCVDLTTAVVGEENSLDAVLDGLLSILDGLDTLGDDGKRGEVGKFVVKVPGEKAEGRICGSDTVACSTVPDTITRGVDGKDNSLGTHLLNLLEQLRGS